MAVYVERNGPVTTVIMERPDARNAVEALLADHPVPVTVTKPHGCSTTWRSSSSPSSIRA